MLTAGWKDRLRKLHFLNLCENPLPEQFARLESGARTVQQLLREAAEFFCRAPRARAAVLCLLALKKFGPPDGVWRGVPRDVVLIVARLVHGSRHDPVWTLRGKVSPVSPAPPSLTIPFGSSSAQGDWNVTCRLGHAVYERTNAMQPKKKRKKR